MTRRRRAEATIALEAASSSILSFEDFVRGLAFLSPRERYRLLLAGDEILDNIVKHAPPVDGDRIVARVRRMRPRAGPGERAPMGGREGSPSPILLGFFFRAPGFAAFAVDDAQGAAPEPLYDPAHRRWRGIGLVMCRNLARRVAFRPGELRDRIFLEFDPETPR